LTPASRPKASLGIGFMDVMGSPFPHGFGSDAADRSGTFCKTLRSGSGVGARRIMTIYLCLSDIRVKQCLSLQQHASQAKQSVCDTAQRTAVRVAALAQGGIAAPALGVVLGGDTCPVIDGVAQPNMSSIAHDDDVRLTAALGHWCGAA
jgi:hypothetical protein